MPLKVVSVLVHVEILVSVDLSAVYSPPLQEESQCPLLKLRKLSEKMARALVPTGVVVQIQLVVILGIPPLRRGQYLGDNLVVPPLLVCFLGHLARDGFLLGGVVKDSAAVLRPSVGALLVAGCGVVHAIKEVEDLRVGDFRGVVNQLGCFGVCGGKISMGKLAIAMEG